MALSADSVLEAVSAAFRRTGRTLFQPFDLGKWFVLGFCAWLAGLGDVGPGPNFRFNVGGPDIGHDLPAVGQWIAEHGRAIALVTALVVLAFLAFTLVILWISSRGKFMFLDGVVHNRGAVVEPWRRYWQPGNRLFGFRVLYSLVVLLALAIVVAACVGLAWGDIARQTLGPASVAAFMLGLVSVAGIAVATMIVSALLDDFVVPVMYLRDARVLAAWGIVWRELVREYPGPVLLFYLMRIALAIAVGVIAIAATCLTCCLATLPYIGTVILLPLLVFMRCYSLCFIEQCGPEWRVFA